MEEEGAGDGRVVLYNGAHIDQEISKDSAESVVKDFVQAVIHKKIKKRLGSSDIIFEHPSIIRKIMKIPLREIGEIRF